jgi:hypothetical protein
MVSIFLGGFVGLYDKFVREDILDSFGDKK